MSKPKINAAILSGGFSRRVGHDKALLPLGDKPLVHHVAERARQVASQVILVAPDAAPYKKIGIPCDIDRRAGIGPLAGLEAALLGIERDSLLLLLACDMPFVSPAALELLIENWDPKYQAVLFRVDGSTLAMPGLYRRDVLFAVDRLLARREHDIADLLKEIRVKEVSEDKVVKVDPDMRTFVNLNTSEAYRRYALEAAGRPPLS